MLQHTKVRKIRMAHGVAKTVPQSVFEGLRQAGVEVVLENRHAGRPEKHSKSVKRKMIAAVAAGMPVAVAVEKFKIPRRTYFYWKKGKEKIK